MTLLNTRILLTALALVFIYSVQAQVILTLPAFPTKFDDVTVYYDATKGNGALAGYHGDVFAHTGVITSESVNGNDWKHVIGNWGTEDARVLMTRVDENLYSISFNITDFYGVPIPELVLKMAFVFRNVNGSIVGRDTDGSDIFTDVYPSDLGLYLTLHSPSAPDVIIFEDDSLYINLTISDDASLEIYDNDNLIFLANSVQEASFYHHPIALGEHLLRFVATADSTVVLEKTFFVIQRNSDKLNPPAGTVNGLNYFTDSTYIFQLYAPLKEYVFLLAPENRYDPHSGFQLHVAEDESTYWIELPDSLFANGKNTYQYLLSGGNRIADPHSEVVLDPFNDAWIAPEVMATLPDYPSGMTSGIVTAFDTIYQTYDFEITDFEKPDKSRLVIYELLLRDFLANHSFKSLLDTLDYFVRLGVNAIELMPINEFEGNVSWGYNPSFHMAVDKYYGTREQLKAFIDAAHQRGIAVILDVVFNHTFSQGPLAQMYWDPVNSRPSAQSPYLNVIPRHPFNVGYDFNHESPATKNWVKRILAYWITEFKFDGFRFDLSKGLTQFNSGNDAGLMARYDASRIAILKNYADHIWDLDSNSYVIMEHFADNNEEIVLSDYGMMLWGNMNYQFSQAAKGFQSDLSWADYTVRGWDDPHIVNYMESHDEERVTYRVLTEGDSEGDYNTRELHTALERMAAASAIHFSIPGPKMIWQFGELGYEYPINRCVNGTISNDCRLDPKPIRWDYLQDFYREKLFKVTAALIYLKTNYPTFSTKDFVFNDGNLFLKTVHLNHPEMDAITLANYRVINSDINPKFKHTGVWYEYFTGDSITVTDTQKKITFGPGEYRIYTSKRITPPEGFNTGTNETDVQEVNFFPTLVSENTFVNGYLPQESQIKSIVISDVDGNQIKISFFLNDNNGFSFQLPVGVPNGIYFIRIHASDRIYIGKLVKQ